MARLHDDASDSAEDLGSAMPGDPQGPDVGRDAPAHDREAELAAIGSEIDSIRQSIAHIAEASSHYVKRRVAENSTDLISENPLRATLWAALAGFLIGRLSR
jgi:ElaB/YqjD/DUF883 family membrane-anchored ribosome-binding protein